MSRVPPVEVGHLRNVFSWWNLDHYPDVSHDVRTRRFLDDTQGRPESRRRPLNALIDLVNDKTVDVADKGEFISEEINQWFDDPADAVAWLEALVEELLAVRPVRRTTSVDGKAPSLLRTHRVRELLRKLKPDIGNLPAPIEAVRVLRQGWAGDLDGTAGDLLELMDSDHRDRDKADFVVDTVGHFFYSDLEAIEWAAEVARGVISRPRAVD